MSERYGTITAFIAANESPLADLSFAYRMRVLMSLYFTPPVVLGSLTRARHRPLQEPLYRYMRRIPDNSSAVGGLL